MRPRGGELSHFPYRTMGICPDVVGDRRSNRLAVQQQLWITNHKKNRHLFGAHVFHMRFHGLKAIDP
jgi:hypothetical protein